MKFALLIALGMATPLAFASASPPILSSRDVSLSYQTTNGAPVDHIRLWVSTNSGRRWTEQKTVATTRGRVHYIAPDDGRYSFYIVLENEAGQSAPIPTNGTPPHSTVVVDTEAPLLQIHKADAISQNDGNSKIKMHISLIDEHLRDSSTRIFYRTGDHQNWQDGGALVVKNSYAIWSAPNVDANAMDIRLVAVDLAGNRAHSLPTSVKLPVVEKVAVPAVAEITPDSSSNEIKVAQSDVETLKQKVKSLEKQKKALEKEVDALRTMAKRYIEQGRYDLATARLKDAHEISPDDTGVLTDMGLVKYRTKQFDQAEQFYQAVANRDPDNVDAIWGLALVAQTEKRYPEARTYLERLQELQPESGMTWLRVGDNQYSLGNRPEATAAWKRVLDVERNNKELRQQAKKRLKLVGAPTGQELAAK